MNIIINQLQKNFGPKVAVDIENYSIQSGNMLGLVGNNGAGKTTLFRLMLDLLKADGGSVHIGNIDVSRSEEWKNITGAFRKATGRSWHFPGSAAIRREPLPPLPLSFRCRRWTAMY